MKKKSPTAGFLLMVRDDARWGIRRANRNGVPVHAYIPMYSVIGGSGAYRMVEENPVAYLNQMEAKRVADAARKRRKRQKRMTDRKYHVVGITIK